MDQIENICKDIGQVIALQEWKDVAENGKSFADMDLTLSKQRLNNIDNIDKIDINEILENHSGKISYHAEQMVDTCFERGVTIEMCNSMMEFFENELSGNIRVYQEFEQEG